ncbi:MAG: S1 RNA-binding domain-containing protein [Hydrogenobacter thermophilus]|uniref:S1 RNA-binding domain-containing protein n=1 Tax=Hydrogenobacter thermophilus TaxID=940 RepID=UPI001C74B5B3|nr:S1 RNA-binding domain-containing protein [Hydrogenobacter thermophilus]QWK20315.1 MAG: S1 RNA-binding domain-containing protein [Hydrogenobacter thermophilus]
MGEFEKLLEKSLEEAREIRRGEIIRCKVIKVDERNIYVDVGYKVEGIIPREEIPDAKEGDEIKAVVTKISRGGSPILSYRKYIEERYIHFLRSAYEKGRFLTGRIKGKTEEGYTVDINGITAFMPLSEAGRKLREGSKVVVKITDFQSTKEGIKLKVSQRAYLAQQEKRKKERLIAKLKVGEVVEGRVIKIDPEKGITLLVQGVLRAFLPKEELSWGRDKNPYNYAEIDEKLRVKVKRIPKDGEFIFVSLREMKENPWDKIGDKINKGDTLSAKVVEVLDKGMLVELQEGVEGFVPKEEISYDGSVSYRKGSEVKVKVLEFEPSRRRLILSVKRALPKPWEEFFKDHPAGSKVMGRVERIEGAKALVDLGNGVKGIVHRSDLSWVKPGRVEEVLKEGQEREFAVLALEGKFIKLGLKQLMPNPWELITKNYTVGQKITLKVKSSHPFGVFLEFPEGVDGLLPLSEIPKGTDLKEGMQVEVKILEIAPEEGRITLSMKEEKEEKKEEVISTSSESGFTLGDILKKKMKL